ncbi:carboxylesterase/lipase family protein [Spirosoma sp. 209]|uniref:carboxylesterase/lipase family protein n=1 Tax=Spirosoma sp. 209 TaxID=1955701 RepID=UPI00098D691A|nr:carboxylesterase family protein [Spirosoma sp. 209]
MKISSLFLCLAALTLLTKPGAGQSSVVPITGGRISGTTNAKGDVRIYRGIPFAAPPVGNLRWKAPQPVVPWSGVRACNAFGPSPMQGSPAPFSMWSAEFLIPKEPISEDCLYLNIWTAARSATEKRPVLVWIYGGGFNSGGSAVPIYDGESTAQKGIVLVSINYRVGAFGFMAHPELTRESGTNASGNYGLLDQIAALQWVRQNIAAFGGDPANVTIAGQSAGSMSVSCLVASPLAKNLFNKAIAQSGAGVGRPYASLKTAEETGVKIMQTLGAASLAELRATPADEIQQKAQGVRGPIIDGYVLPASVTELVTAGRQANISLLTGWNEDEGLLPGPIKPAVEFRKQTEQRYGPDATTLLQYYPAGTDAEADQSQRNLGRDLTFGIQNYSWAMLEGGQGKTVYVYRFRRKLPATGQYASYGAFHTGEVAYAYDNLRFIDHQLRPLNATDADLARIMATYWANFIKTGNPNGQGLPQWPAFSPTGKQTMILDMPAKAQPLPDAAALDFLSGLVGRQP